MNTTEIDNKKVELQKKIIADKNALNTVILEKVKLERQLVDLSESIRQGRFLISQMKAEVDILTSEFWKARNG